MEKGYMEFEPGYFGKTSNGFVYWICNCQDSLSFNAFYSDRCPACGMERPPLPGEKDADEGGKDTE